MTSKKIISETDDTILIHEAVNKFTARPQDWLIDYINATRTIGAMDIKGTIVWPSDILKVRRLTIYHKSILIFKYLPTFIVACETLSLVTDNTSDPRFNATISRPVGAAAEAELRKAYHGVSGAHGPNGAGDRGTDSRNGLNGLDGDPGRDGGAALTPVQGNVLLFYRNFELGNGILPKQELLTFYLEGWKGGDGGTGGNGGNGGKGNDGDIGAGPFCNDPPGRGGDGGHGAAGGRGGNAGPGMHGINLSVVSPEPDRANYFAVRQEGGAPGEPGRPGTSGIGGRKGIGGPVGNGCFESGADGIDRTHLSPANRGPGDISVVNGKRGAKGSFYRDNSDLVFTNT